MTIDLAPKATPAGARRHRAIFGEPGIVAGLIAFALIIRVIFSLSVPPWQAPDEPKHFEYIRLLVDKRAQLWSEHRLFTLDDAQPALQQEIIASMARHNYWQYWGRPVPDVLPSRFYDIWLGSSTQLHRPSLYYLLGGAVLLPFGQQSIEDQLSILRLYSALLSAATVAVTYLAARRLVAGDRFVPVVAGALVAALPMHVFIGAAVNTDDMVTLAGALLALCLVEIIANGLALGRLALAGLGLALALSAKRSGLALVPPAALALLFGMAGSKALRIVLVALIALLCAVSIALEAGALQSWLHLDGFRQLWISYTLNENDQFDRLTRVPLGDPSVQEMIRHQLVMLFRSFWGIFGWYNLPIGKSLYSILAVITALCALGYLAWLGREAYLSWARRAVGCRTNLLVGVVNIVAIGVIIALAVGERLSYLDAGALPQGRYLFATIVPVALVFAQGARALLPRRYLGTTLPIGVCLVALLLLDLVVYTQYIAPAYGIHF